MVRPRWHDAVIVAGIVALLVLGVWALWWDDVRGYFGAEPDEEAPSGVSPTPKGQT